ncbi:hypothetical protein IMSAGC002_02901 [Lachnospiraceae bacterium]|nr:hypothetical protein IMSAGC002_02901 [Lachnospiraceae bacterium]
MGVMPYHHVLNKGYRPGGDPYLIENRTNTLVAEKPLALPKGQLHLTCEYR